MGIRFIAADLDGTLLDSNHQVSADLFPLIAELRAKDIYFAPASGRQFFGVQKEFLPIKDDLMIICENGGMVCLGDEVISFEAMDPQDVCDAILLAREHEGISVMLSCKEQSYYENTKDARFLEEIPNFFPVRTHVEDLLAVAKQTAVCKVALFSENKAEKLILPLCDRFEGKAQVALSGANWVDLMKHGMNKAVAIRAVCEKFGFEKDECMAFGDYLNDLEMLKEVGNSYAMENGHDLVKQAAKYVCPSNDDDGVCRTIRNVLGIDKK